MTRRTSSGTSRASAARRTAIVAALPAPTSPIAVAARDSGMEVVYSGIRLTPEQIAASARDEDPDVIGLSILSGSHMALVPAVLAQLRAQGVDSPVVVGGIIPEEDRPKLLASGVTAVYTPKDFQLSTIMRDIAEIVAANRG